ncbi:MAG: 2-oxoacid:acceptor oxidoreductase family protein [Chloroflexota bacterium]|nr:2-oxoacid:acceptor oxidoreductase family protein [Chloroflexota bacterium]
MSRRLEVRLAGEGGQGIVLAGIILAEAALLDGKNVVLTQAYAAQQRGGPSRTEVIIGSEEIDYPKVLCADVLLALSRDAFHSYGTEVVPGGLIVVDSQRNASAAAAAARIEAFPLVDIAMHQVGDIVVAAVIGLGVIVGLQGVVSQHAIRTALRKRVPRGSVRLNQRALNEGLRLGREARARHRKGAPPG